MISDAESSIGLWSNYYFKMRHHWRVWPTPCVRAHSFVTARALCAGLSLYHSSSRWTSNYDSSKILISNNWMLVVFFILRMSLVVFIVWQYLRNRVWSYWLYDSIFWKQIFWIVFHNIIVSWNQKENKKENIFVRVLMLCNMVFNRRSVNIVMNDAVN